MFSEYKVIVRKGSGPDVSSEEFFVAGYNMTISDAIEAAEHEIKSKYDEVVYVSLMQIEAR
ncbi:MAG: hypothetical protein ABW146_06075 [Candidatus Sedimenticola sp. 6PFRAG7]